jgi:hypothetical protein
MRESGPRRGIPACACHDSILSRNGASGKPGAVHLDEVRKTSKLQLDCLSSLKGVMGALQKNVLGPLRQIGEKANGEEFEEP